MSCSRRTSHNVVSFANSQGVLNTPITPAIKAATGGRRRAG